MTELDRRAFLVRTLGTVLAARLAPAILAAEPAESSFWLREPTCYTGQFTLAHLNEATLKHILPSVRENFFGADPFLKMLKD